MVFGGVFVVGLLGYEFVSLRRWLIELLELVDWC